MNRREYRGAKERAFGKSGIGVTKEMKSEGGGKGFEGL